MLRYYILRSAQCSLQFKDHGSIAKDRVSAIVWCGNMAAAAVADAIGMSMAILMATVIVFNNWFRRLTVM